MLYEITHQPSQYLDRFTATTTTNNDNNDNNNNSINSSVINTHSENNNREQCRDRVDKTLSSLPSVLPPQIEKVSTKVVTQPSSTETSLQEIRRNVFLALNRIIEQYKLDKKREEKEKAALKDREMRENGKHFKTEISHSVCNMREEENEEKEEKKEEKKEKKEEKETIPTISPCPLSSRFYLFQDAHNQQQQLPPQVHTFFNGNKNAKDHIEIKNSNSDSGSNNGHCHHHHRRYRTDNSIDNNSNNYNNDSDNNNKSENNNYTNRNTSQDTIYHQQQNHPQHNNNHHHKKQQPSSHDHITTLKCDVNVPTLPKTTLLKPILTQRDTVSTITPGQTCTSHHNEIHNNMSNDNSSSNNNINNNVGNKNNVGNNSNGSDIGGEIPYHYFAQIKPNKRGYVKLHARIKSDNSIRDQLYRLEYCGTWLKLCAKRYLYLLNDIVGSNIGITNKSNNSSSSSNSNNCSNINNSNISNQIGKSGRGNRNARSSRHLVYKVEWIHPTTGTVLYYWISSEKLHHFSLWPKCACHNINNISGDGSSSAITTTSNNSTMSLDPRLSSRIARHNDSIDSICALGDSSESSATSAQTKIVTGHFYYRDDGDANGDGGSNNSSIIVDTIIDDECDNSRENDENIHLARKRFTHSNRKNRKSFLATGKSHHSNYITSNKHSLHNESGTINPELDRNVESSPLSPYSHTSMRNYSTIVNIGDDEDSSILNFNNSGGGGGGGGGVSDDSDNTSDCDEDILNLNFYTSSLSLHNSQCSDLDKQSSASAIPFDGGDKDDHDEANNTNRGIEINLEYADGDDDNDDSVKRYKDNNKDTIIPASPSTSVLLSSSNDSSVIDVVESLFNGSSSSSNGDDGGDDDDDDNEFNFDSDTITCDNNDNSNVVDGNNNSRKNCFRCIKEKQE
jgi:E3 ubiquitin-protein ligase HUWE1